MNMKNRNDAMTACNDAIAAAREKFAKATAETAAQLAAAREAYRAAAVAYDTAVDAALDHAPGSLMRNGLLLVAEAEMDEARAAHNAESAKHYAKAKPARVVLDAEIAAAYEAFDAAMDA
jgi:hypothetical protein